MNPLDVIIAKPEEEVPDEDVIFYTATSKGWLVNIPTLFGNAQVLSKEHPSILPEAEERFLLNDRRIPLHMLTQFHDFARKNFEAHQSECSAYLTYSPETDDWKLFIPEQYVTHTSVNHKLDPGQIKDGYQAIGTIHSHCDFGAFHSGTDKHDMGKMPGLHITIGHVNTDNPQYALALSVHDSAFTVDYNKIVDATRPLDKNGYATAPDHWLRFVKEGHAPWGATGVRTTYGKKYEPVKPKQNWKQRSPFFAPRTPQSHITEYDWDADDYDWYHQTGTVQQHLFDGQSNNADAFEKHAEEIQRAEEVMESEAFALALKGFHLNYNITYNKYRAEQHLNRLGAFYSVGDETPLLPELTEG